MHYAWSALLDVWSNRTCSHLLEGNYSLFSEHEQQTAWGVMQKCENPLEAFFFYIKCFLVMNWSWSCKFIKNLSSQLKIACRISATYPALVWQEGHQQRESQRYSPLEHFSSPSSGYPHYFPLLYFSLSSSLLSSHLFSVVLPRSPHFPLSHLIIHQLCFSLIQSTFVTKPIKLEIRKQV